MKINLAKSSGFCFGVRRALDIALKSAKMHKNVFMLGDIVHNEDVVKAIEQTGIKKINKLTAGSNKILLIRAHGATQETIKDAKKLGYQIIDATCPMVKEIHKTAAEMEKKGYQIIIIGDKQHEEVQGIKGQLKKTPIVIDQIKSKELKQLKKINKSAIVVQSTQNLEKVEKIVKQLEKIIPKILFFNTICNPTRTKQAEIKKLPLENNVIIIIGSKRSANTKRLFQISHSLNKHSYWIQSKKGIKPAWFKGMKSVGITAGASTPDYITKEVIRYINRLN